MDGGLTWKFKQLENFEGVDFRCLYAFDSLQAIVANAGSPAAILKTIDGGKTWKEVYRNNATEIFLDGIDFWNSKEGMIYGDPIDGRMVILRSADGGESWSEMAEESRPKLEKGEASFAASGTGIRCYGDKKVVVATGGVVSRLWISNNKGVDWFPKEIPIVQGKNSTGIFSVAINRKQWIVVGGDYLADSLNWKSAFYSGNDGSTWSAPKTTVGGYRSCVEFISGKKWIVVGQGGMDASYDNGMNWKKLSDEKGLHVVRRSRGGKKILAAGNGKIVVVELQE